MADGRLPCNTYGGLQIADRHNIFSDDADNLVWDADIPVRTTYLYKEEPSSLMSKEDREFFDQNVLDVVRCIPRGRATTYGAIAKAVGCPNLSRMVGQVVSGISGDGAAPMPAHRVVGNGGVLSGRMAFGTPGRMQELPEEEGIVVVNNRIKNWKSVFWNPIEEIGID